MSIALPELEAAIEALKTLRKEDIMEIKTMARPTEPIRMTCESIAIFLGEKPVRIPDPADRSRMT